MTNATPTGSVCPLRRPPKGKDHPSASRTAFFGLPPDSRNPSSPQPSRLLDSPHHHADVGLADEKSGLGYATFHTSVFGARFLDYDNDGRRDIFMAAGHVLDNIERYRPGTSYAEPKLMFHNAGNGVFVNVSDQLGPDFQTPCVSRGAAVGDFDNDGDLDILVSNNGGPAQLLRNDGGNANHWLQILPIGTRSNRDGVGARLRLSAGDLILYEQKKGGMSYQSAQDPRLHFGLGNFTKIDLIEIRWPSGSVTRLTGIACDQILAIKEGTGIVKYAFPPVQSR